MGGYLAQRSSGYARQEQDAYWTPLWVFTALYSVEPFSCPVDVAPRLRLGYDFLLDQTPKLEIATNPPFSKSEAFVLHSINSTRPVLGKTAMLLPMTWDAAHSRRDFFDKRPFKAKYTLTKRIRWENLEQKPAGPSTNHAWYVWDWKHQGPPIMGWLP